MTNTEGSNILKTSHSGQRHHYFRFSFWGKTLCWWFMIWQMVRALAHGWHVTSSPSCNMFNTCPTMHWSNSQNQWKCKIWSLLLNNNRRLLKLQTSVVTVVFGLLPMGRLILHAHTRLEQYSNCRFFFSLTDWCFHHLFYETWTDGMDAEGVRAKWRGWGIYCRE